MDKLTLIHYTHVLVIFKGLNPSNKIHHKLFWNTKTLHREVQRMHNSDSEFVTCDKYRIKIKKKGIKVIGL